MHLPTVGHKIALHKYPLLKMGIYEMKIKAKWLNLKLEIWRNAKIARCKVRVVK